MDALPWWTYSSDHTRGIQMESNKNKNSEAPTSRNMGDGAGPSQNPQGKTSHEKAVSPRFLVVKDNKNSFETMSPFKVSKLLFGVIGELKSIKKIKDGLLVETASASQSAKLLATRRIGEIEIEVTPHRTLNFSKGVVVCKDLLNCTLEEITEELNDQGVCDVRRIRKRVNGVLVDTPTHILTFNKPTLPAKIKIAFYILKIRLYIPAPMRCFNCQRFGHTSTRCPNDAICVCGKPTHEGQRCEDPMKCVNCKGNHSAMSRDCPTLKQETAIQELKAKENLSYFEAKSRVAVQTPMPGVSYAAATATAIRDTQSIVKELLPQLVNALREIFVTKDIFTHPAAPLPQRPPQDHRTRRQKNDDTEKRKRQEGRIDDISSDESSTSKVSQASTSYKRPRGWQKGRPRKQNTD